MDASSPHCFQPRTVRHTAQARFRPSYRKLNSDRSTKQGSRKVSDQNR